MSTVLAATAEKPLTPAWSSYYEVTPLVVPADERSEIRIRPRYEHAAFTGKVLAKVIPTEGLRAHGKYAYGSNPDTEFHLEADGTLVVSGTFAGEQQHDIDVFYEVPATRWDPARSVCRRFAVYSLNADLYDLVPLRGDFHIHSNLSDGAESPEYTASRYREAGYDFAAITDHFVYPPSLRAMERCGKYTQDFKLFPGEEVHLPGNRVHVLNFGGKYSVNELAAQNPAKFEAEWKAIAETLPPCPDGTQDRTLIHHAAISEWAFREIQRAGGVAMFCHHAWETMTKDVDGWTTDTLIARHNFDLLEVISGYSYAEWRSNNSQIARYYQECAKGNQMAIAGVSDSHGTDTNEYFDWYYTVVFSKDDSFEAIADALRGGRGVAVEAVDGAFPRAYGDPRLVDYVTFLLANYFPHHRDLCRSEGALLRAALDGDEYAANALKALAGRIPAWRKRRFPGTK